MCDLYQIIDVLLGACTLYLWIEVNFLEIFVPYAVPLFIELGHALNPKMDRLKT